MRTKPWQAGMLESLPVRVAGSWLRSPAAACPGLAFAGQRAEGIVRVRQQFLLKVKNGYKFVKGDVYFTPSRIIILPLMTTVAGFLAGFLGVGAGMIIGACDCAYAMHAFLYKGP